MTANSKRANLRYIEHGMIGDAVEEMEPGPAV
jgi:hypothetical protein